MPLAFAGDDATRLKALLDLAEENLRALEWFSGYLNLCPRFVSGEDVEALTRECGVTEEEAYRLLMASACGLDIAGDPWARKMAERYFRPGVHRLDAAACRADPYYASVRLPQARQGEWTLGYKRIEALRPSFQPTCCSCRTGARCRRPGISMSRLRLPLSRKTDGNG